MLDVQTRGLGIVGLARNGCRLRFHVQQEDAVPQSWVTRYTACSDQNFTPRQLRRQPTHHKLYKPIDSNTKSRKQQANAQQKQKENSGLDLSDLDLSSIQLSEKELETLSGLTPALSRRLQNQLLAHLPQAAARTLRRTLSLHTRAGANCDQHPYSRSLSARSSNAASSANLTSAVSDSTEPSDALILSNPSDIPQPSDQPAIGDSEFESKSAIGDNTQIDKKFLENSSHVKTESAVVANKSVTNVSSLPEEKNYETVKIVTPVPAVMASALSEIDKYGSGELDVQQFCTLPRLRRHSNLSRESTPVRTESPFETSIPKIGLLNRDITSRGSSVRSTPDRSLLSKFLIPEQTVSMEEPFSSDSGSLLSEPSYIAAYGAASLPAVGSLRRHSLRLQNDQTKRKRVSRFLRPDFFDTPRDESVYVRMKKDKELETQKILKEIREKRNRSTETSSSRSPATENDVEQFFKDEICYSRTCLSPTSGPTSRERSRSSTPFLPILHNIKESALDSLTKLPAECEFNQFDDDKDFNQLASVEKSKIRRPKSVPVKTIENIGDSQLEISLQDNKPVIFENSPPKTLQKESKLVRPKSYPSSSPSPEKVFITRACKKEENLVKSNHQNNVEVTFSVNLPNKDKPVTLTITEDVASEINISLSSNHTELIENGAIVNDYVTTEESKGKFVKEINAVDKSVVENVDRKGVMSKKKSNTTNKTTKECKENITSEVNVSDVPKISVETLGENNLISKKSESSTGEKKQTIKKKIVKKVSTKTKAVENGSASIESADSKISPEKKKNCQKLKESKDKDRDTSTTENSVNKATTKKKSVLQSIGQKFEKLTSSKSNSPGMNMQKEKELMPPETIRNKREHSVPVQTQPTTESGLIKRAVTLTNVSGLENNSLPSSKTTVSRVLGLFKKLEPKQKSEESAIAPLAIPEPEENVICDLVVNKSRIQSSIDKAKRPTSLLLNGMGRNKNKYSGAASDSILLSSGDNTLEAQENVLNFFDISKQDDTINNEQNRCLNKNNLKLDFSRLPRIKQNVNSRACANDLRKNSEFLNIKDEPLTANGSLKPELQQSSDLEMSNDKNDSESNNQIKSSPKICSADSSIHPYRIHESATPEKEDLLERIRRKSFYTRFNEKRLKRKSNIVGPSAQEYNPASRIHHSQSGDTNCDLSPVKYDLSPTYPIHDLSPNKEYHKALKSELSTNSRHTSRLDNYRTGERSHAYRSLDRKYTGSKSYMEPEGPLSYVSPRYTRTISLFENEDAAEKSGSPARDVHKYSRTLSMYAPGNYATYRPKRIRNPAILLKESEKEISPENILERIRDRKRAAAATNNSKMDTPTETDVRSNIASKSESYGAECVEKTN